MPEVSDVSLLLTEFIRPAEGNAGKLVLRYVIRRFDILVLLSNGAALKLEEHAPGCLQLTKTIHELVFSLITSIGTISAKFTNFRAN